MNMLSSLVTTGPCFPGFLKIWLLCSLSLWLISGCAPSPTANVAGYWIEQQLGGPFVADASKGTATLTGIVRGEDGPIAGASVLVADRSGRPFSAQTDAHGRYRIKGIPPGQYVPAAVAPGYEETTLTALGGIPFLVTLNVGETVAAPPLRLSRHQPEPLPAQVNVWAGEPYTATAPFPAGAIAVSQAFTFERAGILIDTVRLYYPPGQSDANLPLIFAVFPGIIDGWEPVSVAFASAGYTVLAVSPLAIHGLDIDAHTADVRLLLWLARSGRLGLDLAEIPAVAMGGSFSSAILHRLLRDEADQFRAWVTVGGISNAFGGAADFYQGEIELPDAYRFLIPALGAAHVHPMEFLRYSPVYTAAQLPPTLIIHTAADRIIPISQAYELEAALRKAGVAVDVFYYEDVSHYLQIGDDLTAAGQAMYQVVLDFIETQTK